MKRYFDNPEIKKSSFVLVAIMTIFLLLQLEIQEFHNEKLKESYIKSVGTMMARVIDRHPEFEKEITPLVTKNITDEEVAKAKAILAQYGVTTTLENELFPYVNSTSSNQHYFFILLFSAMTIIVFFLNYYQFGGFYEKIRRLTKGAKKVVDGELDVTIQDYQEGDFSKLVFSMNAMKEMIRNHKIEINREKRFLVDLLSDSSHQLKTPISSLMIYNDLMISNDLTVEQRLQFLHDSQSQLNRMNGLIQNVLKLAKLDAKAIELNKDKRSLNETIQEAVDLLKNKAEDRNIHILFNEKNEVVLEHDALWLREALVNIVKNAIEHSPEGDSIRIELVENPVYRSITIEDTGEGIHDDDLPHIFRRFYKGKTSGKSDSVGIGLALSKSIIELHNGMIEVQSELAKGTRVMIRFVKY